MTSIEETTMVATAFDASAVQLAKTDPACLERLVLQADGFVWNVVHRVVQTRSAYSYWQYGLDLQDLHQEGMLAFARAVRSYDACGPASFATYAGVAVAHAVTWALKRCERAATFETRRLEEPAGPGDDRTLGECIEAPCDVAAVALSRTALRDALQRLPVAYRRAALLRLRGLRQWELARVLGVSESGARDMLAGVAAALTGVCARCHSRPVIPGRLWCARCVLENRVRVARSRGLVPHIRHPKPEEVAS